MGISVGSLYQYYKDKGAVLAALAERYHAEGSACIDAALSQVAEPSGLQSAFADLMDGYFSMFQSRPAMRDVWVAIQADKALAEIEMQATRNNADLLLAAIARVSGKPVNMLDGHAMITLMALGEATLRLAVTLPEKEARAVLETYKRMAKSEIAFLLG